MEWRREFVSKEWRMNVQSVRCYRSLPKKIISQLCPTVLVFADDDYELLHASAAWHGAAFPRDASLSEAFR